MKAFDYCDACCLVFSESIGMATTALKVDGPGKLLPSSFKFSSELGKDNQTVAPF